MAYKSKRSQHREIESALLTQLVSLPCLTPHDPHPWDLHGPQQFLREGYRVQYITAELMPSFAEHIHTPFDRLKFVNWGKPAVRITYYDKHKYWLTKDDQLGALAKTAYIQDYLNYLSAKQHKLIEKLNTLPPEHSGQILQEKALLLGKQQQHWQQVLQNPEAYEMVVSTYYSDYRYWYVGYKYRVDETTFDNEAVHLLSPIRESGGQIVATKLNVIFVDTEGILLDHDYQHKEIDSYLSQFDLRSIDIKGQLFAKPRSLPDPLASE